MKIVTDPATRSGLLQDPHLRIRSSTVPIYLPRHVHHIQFKISWKPNPR